MIFTFLSQRLLLAARWLPALAAQSEPRPYTAPGLKGQENDEDGRREIKEHKDQGGREKNEAAKERPPIELKCLLPDGHYIVEGEDAKDDPEDPDPQGVRRRESKERDKRRGEQEEANAQDPHINSEHQHAERTLFHGPPHERPRELLRKRPQGLLRYAG